MSKINHRHKYGKSQESIKNIEDMMRKSTNVRNEKRSQNYIPTDTKRIKIWQLYANQHIHLQNQF